jgi:hypothetical protein
LEWRCGTAEAVPCYKEGNAHPCEMKLRKDGHPAPVTLIPGEDNGMTEKDDLDKIRESAEQSQRAVLVPDLLRSGRSVDEFMWKGDPKASLVQRIGLLIYGAMFLTFFALAVFILLTGGWGGLPVGLVVGALSGIFSFRFLRNAFKKKRRRNL